jgi:hypothetical protein
MKLHLIIEPSLVGAMKLPLDDRRRLGTVALSATPSVLQTRQHIESTLECGDG